MAKEIDIFKQLQQDTKGVAVVGIYNIVKESVEKLIPDMEFKEAVVALGAYVVIIYKGNTFIPVEGLDAVRLEAFADVLQGVSEHVPFLGTFFKQVTPFIEGEDDEYIEGYNDDDVFSIEGLDNEGNFSIEGTGNDEYIETF